MQAVQRVGTRFLAVFSLGACLLALSPITEASLDMVSSIDDQTKRNPATAADSVDLRILRSHLEPHGWQVDWSPSGDLLLYPRVLPPQGPPAQARPAEYDASEIASLDAALRCRGWHARSDGAGGILLYATGQRTPCQSARNDPSPSGESDARQDPVDGDGSRQGSEAVAHYQPIISGQGNRPARSADLVEESIRPDAASARLQSVTADRIDIATQGLARLATALEQHGWSVTTAPSGDLLVHRQSERPRAAINPLNATAARSSTFPERTIRSGDIERLQAALSRAGWRVQSDGAGGILLYPASKRLVRLSRSSQWLGWTAVRRGVMAAPLGAYAASKPTPGPVGVAHRFHADDLSRAASSPASIPATSARYSRIAHGNDGRPAQAASGRA